MCGRALAGGGICGAELLLVLVLVLRMGISNDLIASQRPIYGTAFVCPYAGSDGEPITVVSSFPCNTQQCLGVSVRCIIRQSYQVSSRSGYAGLDLQYASYVGVPDQMGQERHIGT